MNRLALRHAALGFQPAQVVLADVELAIGGGDFLLLAGANGSGKSTLIRSLLGTLPLLAGQREAAPDLCMAYVPQQLDLDPAFPVSVADVVRMGLWHRGAKESKAATLRRIEEALASVSMEHRQGDLFGRLSGGQKQRVLVARSLVMRPNLMLLDEPVSGVDGRATRIILDILHRQVEAGTSVVLVSHQPLALRDFATRAILVKDGNLEELPVAGLCSAEGLEKLWT